MQRYQPPHMRQREGSSQSSTGETSTARIVTSSNTPYQPSTQGRGAAYAPRTSQRDWSKPTGSNSAYTLASPATDLQPMRRSPLKVELDDMELIQSVSRSGGDGAEGDALKDRDVQEKYRRYIDERLEKHYSMFDRARHTPPPSDATEELHSLGSIVLLFRKLREGVVASHRIDTFAIEVFESSAQLAILARNQPQLLSSLSGLVPGLYNAVDARGKARQSEATDTVESLAAALGDMDVQDRRAEFTSILLLHHLSHGDSRSRQIFHSTLIDLTAPIKLRLRTPFSTTSLENPPPTIQPFIDASALSFALRANRALSEETFNAFEYFRLISDPALAGPYERAVLSWAEESVRERAWKVLSKAYIDCGLTWASGWVRLAGTDIEKWASNKGAKVEGQKVRLR